MIKIKTGVCVWLDEMNECVWLSISKTSSKWHFIFVIFFFIFAFQQIQTYGYQRYQITWHRIRKRSQDWAVVLFIAAFPSYSVCVCVCECVSFFSRKQTVRFFILFIRNIHIYFFVFAHRMNVMAWISKIQCIRPSLSQDDSCRNQKGSASFTIA